MEIKSRIERIPKVKLVAGLWLFGSQWEVTLGGSNEIRYIIEWVHENYGKHIKIEYYEHGSDIWVNITKYPRVIRLPNNKNDWLRVHLHEEEDVLAFKLRWL